MSTKSRYPYLHDGFEDCESCLSHLAREGIKTRYAGTDITPEITQRLEYELSVINSGDFAEFFLIARDILHTAHKMGFMVEQIRLNSSLTAYSIGITNIDPITHGFIFEYGFDSSMISCCTSLWLDIANSDNEELTDMLICQYGEDCICNTDDGSYYINIVTGNSKSRYITIRYYDNYPILQEVQCLIKENHCKECNIWKLPISDDKAFELLGSGDTDGIYNYETRGVEKYMRELKPARMEDIAALCTLHASGRIDLVELFINRRHGLVKINYPHSILEKILDETCGIPVYIEQFFLIWHIVGGFTLRQAVIMFYRMEHKHNTVDGEDVVPVDGEVIKRKFVLGAQSKNIDEHTALEIYKMMVTYSDDRFMDSKIFSMCHAYKRYHLAYLKTHYPVEFDLVYKSDND